MVKTAPVAITSARDKMPFEVTPFYPRLARYRLLDCSERRANYRRCQLALGQLTKLTTSCNKTWAGIRNHLPGYPAFVFVRLTVPSTYVPSDPPHWVLATGYWRSLLLALARQPSRILVRAFAECPSHARRQLDARLAELVAQAVGGGQRIFPALLAAAFEQVDLLRLRFK